MDQSVFISYSHLDAQRVQIIAQTLRDELQIPVWYDTRLRGGDSFFSVIAEQILKSQFFIFVVSENSVVSDWCIHELEFAMSETKKIIAVWLEDITPPPRVRLVISNTHYIRSYDLSDGELTDELRKAFAGSLRSENDEEAARAVSAGREEMNFMGDRYFLTQSQREGIKRCLSLEKQGRRSKCFEADRALLLGLAYEQGTGVEKDEKKAEFYYRVAAHKGSADGEFLGAMLPLTDRSKPVSQDLAARLNALADNGSVMAQVYWGDNIYAGLRGQPADQETAYRWWRMAADQNHPAAQYFLAFGYRKGEVVEQDYRLALMYALESAEQEFPRAFRILGFLYENGNFVSKDIARAEEYFNKAISMGDFLSYKYLGDLEYFEHKDYPASVAHYQKAMEYADAGTINSAAPYYSMAWAYEHGQGIEKDVLKGLDLYYKAAQRGHSRSIRRLVDAVLNAKDLLTLEDRLDWFRKAAKLKCPGAERELGDHYIRQENYREATRHYNAGVDQGDISCLPGLFSIYSIAMGIEGYRDREKALDAFQLFFSLWDQSEENTWKKETRKNLLYVYYYCYAVELDVDREHKTPDREHALFYFRKSLETPGGLEFWGKVVTVALGYLRPDTSADTLFLDVPHGEDLVRLAYQNLDKYLDYCHASGQDPNEDLRKLLACCDELIKVHTAKPDSSTAKQNRLMKELNTMREKLASKLGKTQKAAASPQDDLARRIAALLKK